MSCLAAPGALVRSTYTLALLAVGCAHRPAQVFYTPPDVGAALTPCPATFRGLSVREVRAKRWPLKTTFAIVGHLTATYEEGPFHDVYLASDRPDAAASTGTSEKVPRRSAGWVVTDLSDPIVVRLGKATSNPPFIRVGTAETYLTEMHALLARNRDDSGQPIMPARTRFTLPYVPDVNDVARLNAGLAGVTVGIFGGQIAPDYMKDTYLEDFDSMIVTHACRIDGRTAGD